jgi:hypothetical protein
MEKEKRPENELEEYKKLIHKLTDETTEKTVLIKVYTILKYLQ